MVLVMGSKSETRLKAYGNLRYKLISGWIPNCYIDPSNVIYWIHQIQKSPTFQKPNNFQLFDMHMRTIGQASCQLNPKVVTRLFHPEKDTAKIYIDFYPAIFNPPPPPPPNPTSSSTPNKSLQIKNLEVKIVLGNFPSLLLLHESLTWELWSESIARLKEESIKLVRTKLKYHT